MAKVELEADDIEDADEMKASEVEPARPKKKLALIGGVLAVLLLAGAGAGYFLMGNDGNGGAKGAGPETFVELPPMTVNLRSTDGTPRFLRVHLMLVPTSARRQDEIRQKLPLIIDAYQPFLRELRPEDLAGSAAAFRLKEEMLIRANREVGDGAVADVLIQDLVQQ